MKFLEAMAVYLYLKDQVALDTNQRRLLDAAWGVIYAEAQHIIVRESR